ncbi:hypothetical protein [Colwellia sp. BRX8-9]|uniref:hypothetical protein n=1 Tax=Colwellia sp. BRX8-9 TaxID=2759831 RepID=UPI0015F6C724|nr:hypothetical protein [Colwellia sp. BRX8-9]MBA6348330.1 hypothetical protein [Colwellia sp. BRX8-9]
MNNQDRFSHELPNGEFPPLSAYANDLIFTGYELCTQVEAHDFIISEAKTPATLLNQEVLDAGC